MKFEPVRQIRLHEQIVARFNEMAQNGQLQPGDKLPPERELVKQLGVSRQVLREAFALMEAHGMISTTQGGGREFHGPWVGNINALIGALKESALLEILTAREAIECKTAELAAQHASDEEVEQLRDHVAGLKSRRYSYESNYEFHLAIAELSRNSVLHNLLELVLQTRRDVHRQDYLSQDQLARLFEDHAAIVEAIAARDAQRARDHMRRHIETTRKAFEERTRQRTTRRDSVRSPSAD